MKKVTLLFCLISLGSFAQTKPATKTKPKKETKTETVVMPDKKAEYIGGQEAMEKYIISNLKYPDAINQDTTIKTRKVFLKFMIDKTGKVTSVSVMKGIKGCKPCSEEAIRVVSSMPNWSPAVENNQAIESWFNLPITFAKNKP